MSEKRIKIKKILLILMMVFTLMSPEIYLAPLPIYAADVKITALPEDTSPTPDDLLITVNDPGGTPSSKKVTIGNLSKALGLVNVQSFMDGLSGRPTYATWFANQETTDVGPVFRAAVASMSGGGTLLVPGGKYLLNSKVAYTFNAPSGGGSETAYALVPITGNISIVGMSGKNSEIDIGLDDTFYAAFTFGSPNDIEVTGLYIKGTGTAFSNSYGGGIRILGGQRVNVHHNLIEATRGIAINFVGFLPGSFAYYCYKCIASYNHIIDCNGDGIYHIFSDKAITSFNTIENTGWSDAIIYEACDHGVIEGNIIILPNARGILVNTGSSWSVIANNVIYMQSVYEAIYLASVRYCTVIGNNISFETYGGGPGNGITCIPGVYSYTDTYHKISNNTLHNAGSATLKQAIHIQTDYNDIDNNMIASGIYGINIDAGNYNNIRNNTVLGNSQGIGLYGLDGRPNPDHTIVENNVLVPGGISDSGTNTTRRGNRYSTGPVQGRAILVAGTITVSTAEVITGDNILLSRVLTGGTLGNLSIGTIVNVTSFVINSSSATDTSTIYWEISH